MSNISIANLLESASSVETKMKIADQLVQKWEPTGLLEGKDLENSTYGKQHMAILLENQAKRLVVEATQTGTGGTWTAGQGEQWAGIALPLVRKVLADISAKEFLNTQPISQPSGLIFFLDFKYGSQQPTIGGTSDARFDIGDSVYGNTSTPNTDPFGGLYGAGRFGYSINEYNASVSFTITTASFADVNFNANYSASVAAGQLRKLSVVSASSVLSNPDTNAVRSFVATGSGVSEANLFAEFSTYTSTNDTLAFIVSGSTGQLALGSGSATLYYSKQPTDNSRGDFEDTTARPLTGSAAIPQFNLDFRSETVAAKTRKLAATWTPEASQDIEAFQAVDVEQEVTSLISEYISVEIDLELLDMLIAAGNQTTDVWSAQSNKFFNKSTNTFTLAAAGAGGYYNTQGQWFATLGTKIQSVARQIHAKTLRGQANVLMCGPKVSTIIESIPGYAADTDGNKMTYAMGTQKIGQLNSRYKVIVNPYMQENTILMAYKGGQFLESGATFAPYIPLVSTPLVYNPETYRPSKGFMTRFAKKMFRPEFFGKVFVADLDSI